MENAGRWSVSGSKEAMEVPTNFKDLRKLGVRNIAQYTAANVPFPACVFHQHSLLPYYPPCLQERVAREAKPRFGVALVRCAHDCETRLFFCKANTSIT